ncbi:MAG: RNA polymerase sigma factor [Planctomycetota bacterium]
MPVPTAADESPRDELLLLRAGRGDQQAFAELVQRHHVRLYGFFRRRGLDRHAAEDCVQNCLLRLLGAAGSYQPRAPFGGFLARLARNTAVDWQRRSRAPSTADGASDGAAAASRRPVELDAHLAPERCDPGDRLDLRHAVSQLSERLRAVVELSFCDGLSQPEIARLLGIPRNTVKTRMYHALRRLRRTLQ